jgi:hypothetical protein
MRHGYKKMRISWARRRNTAGSVSSHFVLIVAASFGINQHFLFLEPSEAKKNKRK